MNIFEYFEKMEEKIKSEGGSVSIFPSVKIHNDDYGGTGREEHLKELANENMDSWFKMLPKEDFSKDYEKAIIIIDDPIDSGSE